MPISYDFTGKKVVVTGGAQGIGFQISNDFLSAGAQVFVWDYNEESLKIASKKLSFFDKKLTTTVVDVTNVTSCENAAKDAGAIDILINNAGITQDKSFAKMTHQDFEKVINTNLTGLFNVTKSFLDQDLFHQESRNNRIINMASIVALYGNFGQTNYAAAKAGVIGMTKTWGKELGRKGYTVNAIAPGFITTQMTEKLPKDILNSITARVPVQRLGTPKDISHACLFLSSHYASYINGTVLSIDGGMTL